MKRRDRDHYRADGHEDQPYAFGREVQTLDRLDEALPCKSERWPVRPYEPRQRREQRAGAYEQQTSAGWFDTHKREAATATRRFLSQAGFRRRLHWCASRSTVSSGPPTPVCVPQSERVSRHRSRSCAGRGQAKMRRGEPFRFAPHERACVDPQPTPSESSSAGACDAVVCAPASPAGKRQSARADGRRCPTTH